MSTINNEDPTRVMLSGMSDGSEPVLDMAFFKALEGATRAQAEAVFASVAGEAS